MAFRFAGVPIGFVTRLGFLSVLCLTAGCSDQEEGQSRNVLDSLAQIEKTRKDLTPPPVPPPVPKEPTVDRSKVSESTAPKTGSFQVKFETTAGDFVILVHREWAPDGAQRFHELISDGFYNECRFFRVVKGFMVQFGINGDPAIQRRWEQTIPDDPAKESNKRSYVTFATSGLNSRTTQIFINYVDNSFLDSQGFSPFGEVTEGMDNIDKIFSEHGEKPDQGQINARGNEYLKVSFPDLDYVKKATIMSEE